jgi:hypothetical protein
LNDENERVLVQNNELIKPRFEAKLTLRDTIDSLYEGHIKGLSKEMQLLSLKFQTENKRIIDNLASTKSDLE